MSTERIYQKNFDINHDKLEKKQLRSAVTNMPYKNYSFKNQVLTIIDDQLDLSITELLDMPLLPAQLSATSFLKNKELGLKLTLKNDHIISAHLEKNGNKHGQMKQFYDDGTLKSEAYYQNGTLYGPSSFFGPQGQLLSLTWFYQGRREGALHLYYPTGQIYSIQNYKNGLKENLHEYYYDCGALKTKMQFYNDLQVGTTLLYHSNGQLKREVEFEKGKKMGVDRFWNERGVLIEESFYQGLLPYKSFKQWHTNGTLAIERLYHNPPKLFDEWVWAECGRLEKKGIYNAFDQSYTWSIYDQNEKLVEATKGVWNGQELTFSF